MKLDKTLNKLLRASEREFHLLMLSLFQNRNIGT